MLPPKVVTSWRDPDHNVTYHVYAYRKLDRSELRQAVLQYLAHERKKHPRRKRPQRNAVVKILTIIGATDRV